MNWLLALAIAWCVLWALERYLPKWGASKLASASVELQATSREYRSADPGDFQHLDLPWYEGTAANLLAEGYQHLEDVIDVEATRRRPSAATFIRVFVSSDGSTIGSIFHYRERGWLRFLLPKKLSDIRVIDFETEFSDGTFLCTTSAPTNVKFDYGPKVQTRRADSQDVRELHRTHALRVAQRSTHVPDAFPNTCRTADDARALQQRLQHTKGTYRRSLSTPFTESELNTVSDGKYPREASKVVEEFAKSKSGSKDE